MEEATTKMPRIEAPIGIDRDDEELQQFAEKALEHIEGHIRSNEREASAYTDVDSTTEEVLAVQNTRSLDIRARPLENPKVTLWLKDCPVWANDAWTDTIYPKGLNAFNGKVTVTFDVRPF